MANQRSFSEQKIFGKRTNFIAKNGCAGSGKAVRYATDPEYRASLVTVKAWKKAKGK